MQVYLPIAEMSVPAESLALLGIAVGFLSGVFGVGGGFLATPFLLFMGIPPAIAVGTQANQLIATSVTGVLGHWRKGNVDAHLGLMMTAGGMVGTIVGIFLFRVLQHFGHIDLFIAASYVLLLGSIGMMMLFESIAAMMNKSHVTDVQSLSQREFFRNLPYKTRFNKSRLYVSALLPMGIGFLGGIMVSVLGIGGGFVIVPAMIYVLGMPTLLVAGTSLFQIIFISAFACVLHAVTSNTVDIMLALIMMAGGVIGAQVGVRVARHLKGASARVVLALIILGVCLRMLFQLFMQPTDIYNLDTLS